MTGLHSYSTKAAKGRQPYPAMIFLLQLDVDGRERGGQNH